MLRCLEAPTRHCLLARVILYKILDLLHSGVFSAFFSLWEWSRSESNAPAQVLGRHSILVSFE
jgi:hypothetical protein